MQGISAIILISSVLATICSSKLFDSCELANELYYGLHVNNYEEIATWVCIAQHQSNFNTAAVGAGGYYGLFQIGAEFWCNEWTGANKACGVSCNRLMDNDISDDFQCMQVIFAEHERISGNGFNAWTSYKQECDAGRAMKYIDGCFDNYITSKTTQHQNAQQHHKQVYGRKQNTQSVQDNDDTQAATISDHHHHRISATKSQSSLSRARIYDRCELAQELVYKHAIPMEQVAMWVCIAQHESNFNTSAIGTLNADGSGDHGLFQISDIYWCSPPGKGWACGLSCDKLEDEDITDDVTCMKQIHKEHQRLSGDGFNAWTVYSLYCKGRADKYADGCFDDIENEVFPRPGVIAPLHPGPKKGGQVRKTGRVFERCELARELVNKHAIERDIVATWVCIAQHESNFNTSAIGRLNADGSEDHGLFQISDIYWCSPPGVGWVCGLSCARLEDDDISDDVECMKKIYKEHQAINGNGFTAWTVYSAHCSGDVSHYVNGCFIDFDQPSTSSHRPGIMQPEFPATQPEREPQGKIFTACELAHELMNVHHVERKDVATWVCIAQHESNFNTSAIGRLNVDGSEDHGIFQISDLFWCDDKPNGCQVSCKQLRDGNISDDVRCIKKIYAEHQRYSGDGFTAWTVYNVFCKGRSEQYVNGCGLRGTGLSTFEESAPKNAADLISIKKFPFFFSQFDKTKKLQPPVQPTKAPFIWSTRPTTTTKRPFEFAPRTTTTTTIGPAFTYPTRTTTTKKAEVKPQPFRPSLNQLNGEEKGKLDFSLYDFYLKRNSSGKRERVSSTTQPLLTTTTILPTTKYFRNYFNSVPYTTTTAKPTSFLHLNAFKKPSSAAPQSTLRPSFEATTNSQVAEFNIFDFYLQRKSNQNNIDNPTTQITSTSAPSRRNSPTTRHNQNEGFISTTTFDPFSVYKFDRNAYRSKNAESTTKNDFATGGFKSGFDTPTTKRLLIHRSPVDYRIGPSKESEPKFSIREG